MKPLVSILIPAFNAQEWISETLQSAIAQTWERKEIIVVDDGSSDHTVAIARQFESSTVRVMANVHRGAAAARNAAFDLSRGDFIQWLDADDLLAPDKIEKQMESMGSAPSKSTLISGAWGQFMYRHENAKFVPSALWCDLSPREWLIRKMEHNAHMQTATWLLSRELANAAGPWDKSLLYDDDGEYFCRVLMACDAVRFVPGSRVYYRSAPNSLSYLGLSNEKLEAQWRSMQLHIAYVRSLEDSKRVRMACVTYIRNWMPFFYPERLDIFEQASEVSKCLGAELEVPSLSWKYAWIRALFGWHTASQTRRLCRKLRWSLVRRWDKTIYHLQKRA